MITATRRIQFCAGHRVHGHEGKCAHLHGHNYVALITAKVRGSRGPDGLDALGRVIDFGILKERVGGWIDDHWDHGMILWRGDKAAHLACEPLHGKVYCHPTNPTAENMAGHLLFDICPRLFADTRISITKIVLWETENCHATVKRKRSAKDAGITV